MPPRTPGESRAKLSAALAAAQLAHAQDNPDTPQDESAPQGAPAAPQGAMPEGAPGEDVGEQVNPEMQEVQDRIVRLEDILIKNGLTSEQELSSQEQEPSVAQQALPAGATGAPPPMPPQY